MGFFKKYGFGTKKVNPNNFNRSKKNTNRERNEKEKELKNRQVNLYRRGINQELLNAHQTTRKIQQKSFATNSNTRKKEQKNPGHRDHYFETMNGELTLSRLISFLNPDSELLYKPAKANSTTVIKAKALTGAVDLTAVAIKAFTSIDVSNYKILLEFFKNSKTNGVSESFYVLIETCLTDLQIILDFNKIKSIIGEHIDLEKDVLEKELELTMKMSKQFKVSIYNPLLKIDEEKDDYYTGMIITQFVKQFFIFLKTLKSYSYFLVNYDNVYQMVKKELGFGLEEVIDLFKEQLIVMQEICNRTNNCLCQNKDYVNHKNNASILNKFKGKYAANELEKLYEI